MSHSAVVLDASVTATWLLPDEASEASQKVFVRIRRGSLVAHAPELWLWEQPTRNYPACSAAPRPTPFSVATGWW